MNKASLYLSVDESSDPSVGLTEDVLFGYGKFSDSGGFCEALEGV